MNIANPKVSIVIPVYNGSNYLKEAIDSALAQTYKNIEIIVINDGSNDDGATEKIAKSYGDKIRYFKKENGGVATALNLGIQKMTGEYFSWLSHDDMYKPNKINEQINTLKLQKNEKIIIACNAEVLYPNGMKKNEYIDKNTFKFIDIFLATSAVVGVNGCSLLIPKDAFINCGTFNESLLITQDYDLWFRLKDKYDFVLLEKNLIISRRHDEQDGVKKRQISFEAGDILHYGFLNNIRYDRFKKLFSLNPQNIKNYWDNYTVYKENGYKKTASMMLKYIAQYYFDTNRDKYYEIINSEIGTIVKPGFISNNKTKKRLMFHNNVWQKGGVEKILSLLLTYLSEKYECLLVTNNDNLETTTGYTLPNSISHIKINNHNQLAELMDIISLLGIDLFVGNSIFNDSSLDIYPLLSKVNVKTIAYNHGYYFLPYMCGAYLYPVALKIKEAYRSANYVVWPTRMGCNIYNIENNNGIHISSATIINTKIKSKQKSNKNILAIGRFDDEIKRIDKILLVFKELHKTDKNYHLDIVGYCPMEIELPDWGNMKLRDFIYEQEIPISNIKFWGAQNDISRFYSNASFLLLTSRCEAFGLVLVEALAKGVPCACFEYFGIEEIIQDGYNGLLCAQDDYRGLANKIADAIDNDKIFLQMSQNSINSAKKFNIDNYYKEWEKLIKLSIENNINLKQDLQPDKQLTKEDYIKITLNYEKLINNLASEYLNEININSSEIAKPIKRTKKIAQRFRDSIRIDGFFLTVEKIIRKVYRKLTKK